MLYGSMEVEFDVKITRGAMYDYMMYHSYSKISGILSAVAGVIGLMGFLSSHEVIYLIAALLLILYLPWTLFLRAEKQVKGNKAFEEPLHYKLTEEGIEVSQRGQVQQQKWEDVVKAVSSFSSIIVYTGPVNASIFPKKDLGDKKGKVIEIISTHMPPKKVHIRA